MLGDSSQSIGYVGHKVDTQSVAELMVVINLQFPTVGSHLCSVLVRCAGTVSGRRFCTTGNHTVVHTAVPIEGHTQIVIEEPEVGTYVIGLDCLPRKSVGQGCRQREGNLVHIVHYPAGCAGGHDGAEHVGTYILVADRAVRSTDLGE